MALAGIEVDLRQAGCAGRREQLAHLSPYHGCRWPGRGWVSGCGDELGARGWVSFGATILFAGNLQGVTQTMPLAIYLGFESNLDNAVTLSR